MTVFTKPIFLSNFAVLTSYFVIQAVCILFTDV